MEALSSVVNFPGPPPPVAAITGASSGVGRALALELARRGFAVGLLARKEDLLQKLADEIRQAGGRCCISPCDVTQREMVQAAVAKVVTELGPVQLLVANAGIGLPVPATAFDAGKVEKVYRVNVLGAIYAVEAVLPAMLERRRGRIAAVSSLAGYRGFPQAAAYCATKAALRVHFEGLRAELAPCGITVTVVNPGFIRSPMTAPNRFRMPFLMEPDAAAKRIARAILKGRRVYSFPWPMALLVGVLRLVPPALFDRLMRTPPDIAR
jgi:short-subunit dehydrogenase